MEASRDAKYIVSKISEGERGGEGGKGESVLGLEMMSGPGKVTCCELVRGEYALDVCRPS